MDSVTAVRLFTNKSEINDRAAISNFVGHSDYFNLQNQTIDQIEHISFFTKDMVTFSSLSERFSVEKSGNEFLFTSVSTPVAVSRLDGMIRYKGNKIAISTADGISYVRPEVRVGHGSYRDLQLSLFAFKLTKNDQGKYEKYSGIVFNEFDADYINSLDGNDTLAVQEFTVRFKTRE